jgi:hypothetical protein
MPNLTLPIGYELDGPNVRRVAQALIDGCPNGLPARVVIDFSQLGFIKPAGVTFLSNLILWLQSRNVQVEFDGHTRNNAALRFLDDSRFFERHLGAPLNDTASVRNTTLPLKDVHHQDSFAWVRQTMVPWLANALNVTRPSLYTFQTCVSEMFNNIKDHSSREIGSVFAQHFPNMHRVGISVADFGRGIPVSVRSVQPGLSDNDSIKRAVQRNFTAHSTPGNQGAGLDYLLQTAVINNGGTVTIYSLTGAVHFEPGGTGVNANVLPHVGFCPGTTIDMWLRTDTIVNLDEEAEEFEW